MHNEKKKQKPSTITKYVVTFFATDTKYLFFYKMYVFYVSIYLYIIISVSLLYVLEMF